MSELSQQPNQQAQPSLQEQSQPSFAVPDAYQGKGWVNSVKSVDDLWKLTDNAQSLIGKRPAGIPANDAPEEEWTKFYNTLRPEKPDAYQLPDVEGIPEGFDVSLFKTKAAQIAHEIGLSPRQAAKMWDLYLKTELETVGKHKQSREDQGKQLDADFDAAVKEVFGDSYDQAAQAAQELIRTGVPENLLPAYEQLAENPKAMAAVIKALSYAHEQINTIKKQYGAEGKLTTGAQTTGMAIEDVRRELASLRTSQEARDFTSSGHKKTMERIQELSGIVKSHYSK